MNGRGEIDFGGDGERARWASSCTNNRSITRGARDHPNNKRDHHFWSPQSRAKRAKRAKRGCRIDHLAEAFVAFGAFGRAFSPKSLPSAGVPHPAGQIVYESQKGFVRG